MLIGVVVVLTRLPFLGHGYGSDADAWRVMIAAQNFLDTGVYVPSRPPGYPLPEYIDTAMLWIGLGSSFWIGALSAILSGIAAALLLRILSPLGTARAAAGALAFASTPVVYVASLGSLDYLWGLTFFLAATVFATQRRVWWMSLFLGLAAASRPTYALAAIPLILLFDRRMWKALVLPVVCAGVIAFAFYVPAMRALGAGILWTEPGVDNWKHAMFYASVGLFGVLGFIAVACAVVSAVVNRRHSAGQRLDWWAWSAIGVYGLLFVVMPQEPAYLIPALAGLYWLLCRYAHQTVLWAMVAALLVSCFVLSVGGQPIRVNAKGPVLYELQVQDERSCVAAFLKNRLATTDDYVIAGTSRPQLVVQLGKPLSDRILYAVSPDSSEGVAFPENAHLWLLDQARRQQEIAWREHHFPVMTSPCS